MLDSTSSSISSVITCRILIPAHSVMHRTCIELRPDDTTTFLFGSSSVVCFHSFRSSSLSVHHTYLSFNACPSTKCRTECSGNPHIVSSRQPPVLVDLFLPLPRPSFVFAPSLPSLLPLRGLLLFPRMSILHNPLSPK